MVLICGSRNWSDVHAIRKELVRLPPNATIIHGGAPGADRTAGWLAEDLGFTVHEYLADWKRHGRRAGILRNLEMLDAGPDLVIAFQRNGSKGTQHTIDEAKRRGIPMVILVA
jgi:hypothetical protein